MFRLCASAAAVQQPTDIIGRSHLGETARRRQRGVAIPGGDIEHTFAGAQIDGLANAFTDDLQGGADDGIIAGGPGGLLAFFDGGNVRAGVCDGHDGLRSNQFRKVYRPRTSEAE